ncbi:hypothetical protein [Nocardioides sp.]|uniref:hypothetical protein n=1 Tax=Nocardioides sp. TaxID=35761 RepID=UPI00271956F8|nr:hypothetical protein [Nocardioides sp.]MDO9457064.1 hypothetical protein [Nocardioides sp.]
MGILSRVVPGRVAGSSAEAVHARVADGEHLWLAVRGAESLVLVRDGGPDVAVDVVSETHGDETLLTAVVPVAAALADDPAREVELWLAHGRKHQPVTAAWAPRPETPTLDAPVTADRRWQLSVHDEGGRVVVRRSPVAPVVVVLGITTVDDGVAVRLGSPAPLTTVTVGGVTLPVTDGVVVLGDVPGLRLETNLPLEADGVAVARARNVMERPHYATAFPTLPAPDLELRWLRDGRLALFRREGGAS